MGSAGLRAASIGQLLPHGFKLRQHLEIGQIRQTSAFASSICSSVMRAYYTKTTPIIARANILGSSQRTHL
jgi:hypothetical protein